MSLSINPIAVETIFNKETKVINFGALFPIKDGWETIPFLQIGYNPKVVDLKPFLSSLVNRITHLVRADKMRKGMYGALISNLKREYPMLHMSYVDWDDLAEEVNKLAEPKNTDHMDAVAYACCAMPLIYPNFNTLGATTGRVTTSGPNQSNVPRHIDKTISLGLGARLAEGLDNVYRIYGDGYTLQIVENETGFVMPVARFLNPELHHSVSRDKLVAHKQAVKMLFNSFADLVRKGELSKQSYEVWLTMAKPYLKEHRTYELLSQMVLGAELSWEKVNRNTECVDNG